MFWRITEDKVSDDAARVGVSAGTKKQGAPLFIAKIFDDDGEHYYSVEFDAEAFHASEADGSPGDLYDALKYAEWDAGATDLRVSLKTIEKLYPPNAAVLKIYRESIVRPDGWCSIYG